MIETEAALSWDALEVGTRVGPLRHAIRPEDVAAFDIVTGGADAADGAAMPPTLLATDYVLLMHGVLDLGHGLMTRHETRSIAPVRIGDTVSVTGTVTEKFEKRGRHYWTLRYEVRDPDDRLCVVHAVTCTVD